MSKSWAEVVKVSLNRFVQSMTQKKKKYNNLSYPRSYINKILAKY